jgi:hypothetical protein
MDGLTLHSSGSWIVTDRGLLADDTRPVQGRCTTHTVAGYGRALARRDRLVQVVESQPIYRAKF